MSIEICGELKPRGMLKLFEAFCSESFGEWMTPEKRWEFERALLDAHNGGRRFFSDDQEVNYGNVDDIEGACEENRICYIIYNDAGGDYGQAYRSYDPATNRCYICPAVEGEPVIALSDLVKAHKDGTVDAAIAVMTLARGNGLPDRLTLSPGLLKALQTRHARDIASEALGLEKVR